MKILFVRSGNNGTDPITQNQGESLRREGIEIEFFNISGKGVWGYCRNLFILRDVVKMTNPDIIHAHYVFSGILTSFSFSGKPVVTSLMGSDVNNAGLFTLGLIKFFTRFIWNATIVKAKCMYDKLGYRNIFIVPNGVDLNMFKPVDRVYAKTILGRSSRNYNILFPADPRRKEKNFDLFQKAMNILKIKLPNV
jgi:glycosyltransferase involved in cell wall biosynthesis